MSSSLKKITEVATVHGVYRRFWHQSESLGGLYATFSVFIPKSVTTTNKAPCLYYLSGLTCTDEVFAQQCATGLEHAAKAGLILIFPDTSPRGAGIAGENDRWNFGLSAGYYVNATKKPFAKNYRMYDYVTKELYELVNNNFPVDPTKISITGHSMGGHGAMVIGLRNPGKYRSISAFAPFCNLSIVPWGIYAFSNFLGDDKEAWKEYDTVELLKANTYSTPMLVDVGAEDGVEVGPVNQLQTMKLKELKHRVSPGVIVNYRKGHDHSYDFVSAFIQDHIEFHMKHLQ